MARADLSVKWKNLTAKDNFAEIKALAAAELGKMFGSMEASTASYGRTFALAA